MQTTASIRKTLLIIKHVRLQKLDVEDATEDAEKAFDSVRLEFLYKTISLFGFHPKITEVFSTVYNKPTARLE